MLNAKFTQSEYPPAMNAALLNCLILFSLLTATGSPCFAEAGSVNDAAEEKEEFTSLGVYVTLLRLTEITNNGLIAIPQGAVVTVMVDSRGNKFAAFRQSRVRINDFKSLSNDPQKIANAAAGPATVSAQQSGETTAGSELADPNMAAPQAQTSEQILVDDAGNIISRSKTTTISDGAGNTTVIKQGRTGGMTPERAARLAAARQKIEQQRQAINEIKIRRTQGRIVSGYEGKLKEMTDLLARMEVEYARMQAEFSQ